MKLYWEYAYCAKHKYLKNIQQSKSVEQETFRQSDVQFAIRGTTQYIKNLSYSHFLVDRKNSVFKWLEEERRCKPFPDLLVQLEIRPIDHRDTNLFYKELPNAFLIAGQ